MDRANRLVSRAALPTFIKVYLLGMLETLAIVLWKRALLGSTSREQIEDMVDHLCSQHKYERPPTAIITGGDAGIGFEITCGLLRAGFHVILASRSPAAVKEAQKQMYAITKSNRISFYVLDLCSYTSVHRFVDHIKTAYPRGSIDVLINNAGVMNIPFAMTEDGIETQFQTNYLSPTLLSLSLLPWMHPERGHVLFASSSTLFAATDLNPMLARTAYSWDGLTHYAHSKMAIALTASMLSQKLQAMGSQITVSSYHPGTVRTNLFASTTVFTLPMTGLLFDVIMLSPKEGSATPLYLILSQLDGEKTRSGQYWSDAMPHALPGPIKIKSTSPLSHATQETLWTSMLALCDISPLQVNDWIKESMKM
ncbi:hypothetical protein BC940DRAFT_338286 [Gongronella butleri]|nr:hypothetical protein BC940DRAFT_338286 [Gongronella butleri]